ncbi:putative adhesin [Aspergillus stella-maris]|uniref:putative adhesin n=1 Tax=Aspergillus stella-maris TaxID=1810926 RepID=UPI003CCCDBB2
MKTSTLSSILLLSLTALATAKPAPPPKCGTCNPISGQNSCDITTSCINTGTRFHCACRAGYKASKKNKDITKQFRLPMPDYEFLVFTPESTECNTLCDNPYGYSKELCAEVPIYDKCAV